MSYSRTGTYEKPDRRGKTPGGSQMALCEMAVAAAKNERKKHEQEGDCKSVYSDRERELSEIIID